MLLFNVIILFSISHFVESLAGLDVRPYFNQNQWSCIKNAGYSFSQVFVTNSDGTINTQAVANIKNAIGAGITVYSSMDICISANCPNASNQVDTIVEYLAQNRLYTGGIFLNFFDRASAWSGNAKSNIAFIQAMVNEFENLHKYPLFFSSQSSWNYITGNSTLFSQYPLWYYNNDGQQNFDDWELGAFGGWSQPSIKWYTDGSVCGYYYDVDYAPELFPQYATTIIKS